MLKRIKNKIQKNNFTGGNLITTYVLKIIMILLLIIAIWSNNYMGIFFCIIGIILSFIPSILKNNYNITLPLFLDSLITIALFLHIGGVVLDAYNIIPAYDILTHFISSIVVALLAFITIYILDEYWNGLYMDKYAMAFVVVIFTMAMGVVWELLEWTADLFITKGMQSGFYDTMKDLMIDTIAGCFMAIIGLNMINKGKFKKITKNIGTQFNLNIINKKS